MATEDKVILHGFWASPYAKRVELALKAKGIPYEYVEEDLMNKSPEFVALNPVYKKVPVLVHNGRSICESLVIIEYIDETWKDGPKLLPEDPYLRAHTRFWANFIDQHVILPMIKVFKTDGDEQQKYIAELNEKLQVLDEHLTDYDPDFICVDNEHLGVLDIVFGSVFGGDNVQEEVLGTTVIDEEKIPTVCIWIQSLIVNPLIKEASIPKEKIVGFLKFIRHNALKSSSD